MLQTIRPQLPIDFVKIGHSKSTNIADNLAPFPISFVKLRLSRSTYDAGNLALAPFQLFETDSNLEKLKNN